MSLSHRSWFHAIFCVKWWIVMHHLAARGNAASGFFILMSGWDGKGHVLVYYFLLFPSVAGINNRIGRVLIWSSDSESVCRLFSAPSHIRGHTLTVMACSSLSRTNSSVCSDRKVFIRITSDIPLPSARRLFGLFETRVVKMFWSRSCCEVRLPDGALMNNWNGCAPAPAPPLAPSSSVYPPPPTSPRKEKKNPYI